MQEPRNRSLYVFGSNGECQLGIPAADVVDTPTLVTNYPFMGDVKSIKGGDNHTIVLQDAKCVSAAGNNRKGQCFYTTHGISEEEPRVEEFQKMYRGATFIAATCESSAQVIHHPKTGYGQILSRGHGQWGELGHGDDVTNSSGFGPELPVIDPLPGPVVDFAAGVWHYVAALNDGSVYGWGKARLGQLGDNHFGKVTSPVKLDGIPFKPVRVICGKDFTYLVGEPSTGDHVVLGKDKFNIISDMPLSIAGWKDMGATWHAIFVLFEDGRLIAWGRNTMWELVPAGLPLIEKIAVGSEHVLALTRDGKLISWGWGKHGNCGDLSHLQEKVKNDMVSGFWNEIKLPGNVEFIGAGYCTSFVVIV
jgi:protein ATS1